MRNILKNAETTHINNLYGFYGGNWDDKFIKAEPNQDGTYTDTAFNKPFFGTGLYYMEYEYDTQTGSSQAAGYRLLHETGNQAIFTIPEYRNGDQGWKEYPKTVTGTTVIECGADGLETTTNYLMYINTEYNGIELYYVPTQGDESEWCQFKTSAQYLKLINPIVEADYLTSIKPGVTYNGTKVSYNGNQRDVIVSVLNAASPEEGTIERFTTYTDFFYVDPSKFDEWGTEATARGTWNWTGIYCYDENWLRVGETDGFRNGFRIPDETKYIGVEFFYVEIK